MGVGKRRGAGGGVVLTFGISIDIPRGVEGNLRTILDIVGEGSLKMRQSGSFISMQSRYLHEL